MELSIVIPLYNEEACVDQLYQELAAELPLLKKEYEIIFVDDGSSDRTFDKIKDICKENNNIKLVSLTKRFGLSAALAAGFKFAKGKVIASMDGDLQNNPKDLKFLLEELQKGYDIVSGYRKRRHDAVLTKRLPSVIANGIGRFMFGLDIHDFSSTYKVYRQSSIDKMIIFNGAHRFIPVLAKQNSLSLSEVAVSHRPRKTGVSKFGLTERIFKVIKDALVVKVSGTFFDLGFSWSLKEAKFEIKSII